MSEIWDKATARLSFAKLTAVACGHAFPRGQGGDALEAFAANTTATYVDGDGDEITISSDAELEECFLQVAKGFPACPPFRITLAVPPRCANRVHATHKFCSVTPGERPFMSGRIRLQKIQKKKQDGKAPSAGEGKPVAGEVKPAETSAAAVPRDLGNFEKDFFVHARHTCDGCGKSPIIGTRHHATKIPDFDLCTACVEKYEGDSLDFVPAIHGASQ